VTSSTGRSLSRESCEVRCVIAVKKNPKREATVADHKLIVRTAIALLVANARYWPTVAPAVRSQLHRWEQRARKISDPALKALALQKLHEEGFNAEVAATLAVTSPSAYRGRVVQAIVAFEVMYDYLDGLTEQLVSDSLGNGRQLFSAFTDALALDTHAGRDYYHYHSQSGDGGYLDELSATVRASLAELPAAAVIIDVAQQAAARCAETQARAHAVARTGTEPLERWAMREAAGTGLRWNEYLAGAASSVLTVHALIAAAADRNTKPEQAVAIDRVYLSIGVLTTLFDSLIDYQGDMNTDKLGYIRYYDDHDLLARRLAGIARNAVADARNAPNEAHHVMTLVGVVAFYASAPTATSEVARPVIEHLSRQLRPLIGPTLAVMRTWRLAKKLRHAAAMRCS
jgi:tetraprenyl-beta-curcumene synthase